MAELDSAAIGDEITVEVKGPDPKQWGAGQAVAPVEETGPAPLPDGVKGPDPAVWGDKHAAAPVPDTDGKR